jgi:manganese/zinc/iron transport system substrate-binding protein
MQKLHIILSTSIILALLSACGGRAAGPPADLADRPINVVATVGMIADAVKNIGAERVNVKGLMGPGIDPHLYRPSASDVKALGDADVIFYGGLELEGRMTEIFEKLGRSGTPTIAVSEGIDPAKLRKPIEFEGKYDPHVWFDVTLWQDAVRTIGKHMAEIDPESRVMYERNTAAYLAQLDELHSYAQQRIASIPPESRVLITAHDAFGYFGQQYGMEVRGLQGTSTATEAGAADVQGLATYICERKVRAIFVESSVPPATIEAVQSAAQARGCSVGIGEQLFSDALGAEGTPEGTYIGMVRHNVDAIANALRA